MKKKTLVIISAAVFLSACGGGATETVTPEETVAETEAETEAETAAPAAEATAEPIEMGTAGTVGEWEITISSMEIVDEVPDGYVTFTPDDGNKYLLAAIKGSNLAKEAQTFLSSFPFGGDLQAKLLYGDGYEFTQTNLLGYSKGVPDSSVNPLSAKEGNIVFEIPDSVADSTDELIIEFQCNGQTLDIKVR